ncbi:MAG: RAMP superfamily CRISPR-associated protein [Bacteroidetes bacterium]|nr:RAMP superfamily CRISPR-associated protein [Bacteroidota bacterium]
MEITYQIQFHSFWHSGSGLSGGVVTDATVLKDENGLPYIAGKTLKGLLREAAQKILNSGTRLITQDFFNQVFGAKKQSTGTICHFTNAYLSENLANANDLQQNKSLLYQQLSSTAINEKGQAVAHSLRQMEVTIPLVLYAQIIDFPNNSDFEKELNYCLQYVKAMGTKRHRGLGRCDWSIIQN